jgi:hypothetical protein
VPVLPPAPPIASPSPSPTPVEGVKCGDRLLHRATVVGIDGPSYRLRAHQRHADTIRAAAANRAA